MDTIKGIVIPIATPIICLMSNQDLTDVSHETTVGDTQQIPSLFRQIGNQLDVTDCQGKLKLVFQSGFLQHVRHMEFDR